MPLFRGPMMYKVPGFSYNDPCYCLKINVLVFVSGQQRRCGYQDGPSQYRNLLCQLPPRRTPRALREKEPGEFDHSYRQWTLKLATLETTEGIGEFRFSKIKRLKQQVSISRIPKSCAVVRLVLALFIP